MDAEGPLAALGRQPGQRDEYVAERKAGATVDGRPLQPIDAHIDGRVARRAVGVPGQLARLVPVPRPGRGRASTSARSRAAPSTPTSTAVADAHGPWDYLGGMLVCTEAGGAVADANGRSLVVLEHDARRTPIAAGHPALLGRGGRGPSISCAVTAYPERVIARVHRWLLLVYRHLPSRLRRSVVRLVSPTFSVGAICLIERADGRVLLIRQLYRRHWGLPGGLLQQA